MLSSVRNVLSPETPNPRISIVSAISEERLIERNKNGRNVGNSSLILSTAVSFGIPLTL
jgi:hypothetical protein